MNLRRRASQAIVAAVLGMFGVAVASAQTGTIVTFDVPGSTGTSACSINNHGVIVGYYGDQNGVQHGFVRAPDGAIATFNIPGSSETFPVSISNISNTGLITGHSEDAAGDHGFLLVPNQPVITFDAPGATAFGTMPSSVNNRGDVAGSYMDGSMVFHGFLRRRDGAIEPFDAPGANSVPLDGTTAYAINCGSLNLSHHLPRAASSLG
jgi:hypothetical protein